MATKRHAGTATGRKIQETAAHSGARLLAAAGDDPHVLLDMIRMMDAIVARRKTKKST